MTQPVRDITGLCPPHTLRFTALNTLFGGGHGRKTNVLSEARFVIAALPRCKNKSFERNGCFVPFVTRAMTLGCRDGYVGSSCQFRDPCASSPCTNGGSCRAVSKGNAVDFNCTCKLGFTDRRCLTPLNNVCVSSPCRNGGTCELESLETYKCRCPPGWSGKLCQQADPCASNPCANGGQCSAIDSQYICTCAPSFSGKSCKQDVNECDASPSPCRNGGACVNEFGGFRCQCPQEYTGKYCESRYLPCNPSPCHNGGTCIQKGETSYECSCVPGFTGKNCNHNIDDCPGHECQNGGTCVDGVNTYNCQCKPEFTGQLCTEDVDECQLMPNACQNGGTCHNTYGSYQCVCVNGWTGDDCSENIDDCASAACHQGSTCHDRVASFYCECPHGRTGLLCQLDDACISNPCQKGSNCDTNPVSGNHFCTCPSGYIGASCDQDVDECSLGSNPCEHAGKCINTKGSFQCKCQRGYVGPRCELDINECISNPCMNEATCLDQIGDFHCICMPGISCFVFWECEIASRWPTNPTPCWSSFANWTGFTGNVCQIDVDECASTPCKNGAKCTDGPNKYTCECTEGYSGRHCETDVNECYSDPCHYGTCIDGLASFSCRCRAGYTGRLCETNINECLSQPCRNGGTCQDRENAYVCSCPQGTTGINCEINIDDCKSNPCDYGTCIDKINGYECACEPGYTGPMCNINIDECAINPCHNGGTCIDGVNGFTCACPDGYQDPTCFSQVNECLSNPCIHGHCEDKINGYNCLCDSGWSGKNCDINNNECESNPCMNGGTCKDMTSGYVCTCRAGFTGPNCQTNINECASNPCLNQGTCIDDVAGYKCNCILPYTGENCETLMAPCSSKPCKHGGVCQESEDYQSFSCVCPEGWQGQTCEVDIKECVKNPCRNGATCQNTLGSYRCACKPGFAGRNCESNIDDCKPNPCSNGGLCQDEVNGFLCTCLAGFRGTKCEEDINECESNPCKNGANCTDCVNSYTCTCPPGFSGIHCENNTPDCTESNSSFVICLDAGNVHYCHCQVGYTGSYCEEQVDECTPNPCQNGATCTDFLGGYTCKCAPGYVGTNCSDDINECFSQPCQNGGTCIDLINTYKCSCPRGTQGVHCEINIDDCNPFTDPVTKEPKCFNKGKCVDRVGGYHCICSAGYVGERCEGDINECLSNPCDPRGTHSCIQLTNNYRCDCRTGYGFTGSTCEYDAQACGSLNCRNGGTCISGHKSPKCLCTPSFTGPECQYPTDSPCNSNPCYNGGVCEYTSEAPYYHCVCPAVFNGLRCHILDYSFKGGFGHDIPPPSGVEVTCDIPLCEEAKHNKYCDVLCNNHACGWDNGDCSLNFDDPWKNCSAALQCWRYFNDGKCDSQCDNAGCLYDGFDCQNLEGQCNPLYDQYCKDHYADDHCDQGCNNAECEWDGLDCANNMPEKLALGQLVLVVHIAPELLVNNSFGFLRELSRVLRTNVMFRKEATGGLMVYPYYGSEHELKKYNVKRSVDSWAEVPGGVLDVVKRSLLDVAGGSRRKKRELDLLQIKGSVVHLEVDNRQCFQQSTECFQSTNDAAAFLGALASSGKLDVPYTIEAVYSGVDPQPSQELYPIYLVLGGVGMLAFLGVGMVAARKRRHEHGRLWLPDGFKTTETSKKKRREPVGEDSVGLKPLKNPSDISLMDDTHNEWGEDEPSDAKRFRFDEQAILEVDDQTDHRQWTQQHLDAADLRIPSIAPTPPQGEIENDCMDVNVRGPDGFTPLMIASCSGGGLETGNSEEEEDASANVINDFIYQGANLHNQTDRTGETALHLAARYARSDAAKRLLEASADANVQDNMGRTPLHAAVAADAQGVFQILIRNRATDLDARMHDGTTPLILAARLAVEGMVEELINCHADVNAIDDFGKSALHWAAAVNNVEAVIVLLKNSANKDMQNNKEETPLFLAAREGSYETAKVLLDHYANREITDHMDRLPRDIAQERMHHDIVRLMDDYNLVRSPHMHGGSLGTTLSPPLCSPNGYLGGMKQPQPQGQGKKARKPTAKGIGCKEGKDMKVKKKNSQDGKPGNLLDGSGVLSPVDSLESPHGYVSDVASPPMMTSPFQQSPSVALNHLQGMSDPHLSVNHMVMPNKQELARMQFDPLPPRLTHLPVSGSGGPGAINGQCDWLSRMHGNMSQPGQFNPMRGAPGGQGGLHPGGQHGMMTSLHNGHPASLSQMMTYQGIQSTRLGPQPHIRQAQQMQQMQNLQQLQQQQQQSIQLQHQNSSTTSGQSFIGGELSSPELQQGGGNSSMPIHTILPQETQIMPTAVSQSMASTQFLTPPSQHSYSGPMDNTPNHQVQVPDHPFLTPSPGSPDQWSSSSPHSNMSDWSEGISSPPTSMQAQIAHLPEQFK
uniref:Neurogenic locus notch homolog protein 1 n=1 Tax=Gasterosteus aculeatus aculeatus TaxID=481459 RepID=A0AAQ4PW40_GASAC